MSEQFPESAPNPDIVENPLELAGELAAAHEAEVAARKAEAEARKREEETKRIRDAHEAHVKEWVNPTSRASMLGFEKTQKHLEKLDEWQESHEATRAANTQEAGEGHAETRISVEDAFTKSLSGRSNGYYGASLHEQPSHEDMYGKAGLLELVRAMTEAELRDDRTTIEDIKPFYSQKLDELVDKANAERSGRPDILKNKDGSDIDPHEAWEEQLDAYADKYRKELTAKSPDAPKEDHSEPEADAVEPEPAAAPEAGASISTPEPEEPKEPAHQPDFNDRLKAFADLVGENVPAGDELAYLADEVSKVKQNEDGRYFYHDAETGELTEVPARTLAGLRRYLEELKDKQSGESVPKQDDGSHTPDTSGHDTPKVDDEPDAPEQPAAQAGETDFEGLPLMRKRGRKVGQPVGTMGKAINRLRKLGFETPDYNDPTKRDDELSPRIQAYLAGSALPAIKSSSEPYVPVGDRIMKSTKKAGQGAAKMLRSAQERRNSRRSAEEDEAARNLLRRSRRNIGVAAVQAASRAVRRRA